MIDAEVCEGDFNVVGYYNQIINNDQDESAPIAAMSALKEFTKQIQPNTVSELIMSVRDAVLELKQATNNSISVSAGCDLFLQRAKRLALGELKQCLETLIWESEEYIERSKTYRDAVAQEGSRFICDGQTILIHSYSRAVMCLLKKAADQNKRFQVYVTESRPDSSGVHAAEELAAYDIPTKVILDTTVGYIIEKVDLVLVGAEGVVENGGLINKIGTYQLAIVAKEAKKPFYALTESYKFVRLYPLSQYDLPSAKPGLTTFQNNNDRDWRRQLEAENPILDYTPPEYITFLFTNLGVMTPSGVSDELIKFYYV